VFIVPQSDSANPIFMNTTTGWISTFQTPTESFTKYQISTNIQQNVNVAV